jgi:hypothetical protein
MQPTLAWILATLSAVLFLAAALAWRLDRRFGRQQKLPTEWGLSARPVFSADERRAYRQLREALPEHVVLAKLPLVRFCQPMDPRQVRYWYDLLGNVHVSFAICSANGRVLAAIDLEGVRSPSRRSVEIKQSVLAACRIRYLRCPPEHLPSIPELQLLVPQAASAPRGPQAAAAAAWRPHDATQPAARRREFAALWKETASTQDYFLGNGRGTPAAPAAARAPGSAPGWGKLRLSDDDIGGVVVETPAFATGFVAPPTQADAPAEPTSPGSLHPAVSPARIDPPGTERAGLTPVAAPASNLRH